MHQKISIVFPIVVPISTDRVCSDSTNIINLAELLSFSTVDNYMAFVVIITYKMGSTYEKSVK